MEVKIKLLHPDAKIPTKAYPDDFCYDCYAVSEEEVAPNVWKYRLGFALQIGDDIAEYLKLYVSHGITIRPRSSIWKTGMILSNSLGTVDKSYTGEISAVFYHVLPDLPRYKKGDKICQLHLDSSPNIQFKEVEKLAPTERGGKGYGSTGK